MAAPHRRSTRPCTASSTPPHVDHLHPDSGIAIATASDGEQLTKEIYGDRVVWVPWRRPGFQLGLDIAAIANSNPHAVGVILGGHGITAWGATSDEAEANSRWMIETAQAYLDARGKPQPFGPPVDARRALDPVARRAKAAALAPHLRAVASHDHRMVGHFNDTDVVLEFLAGEKLYDLAALGTSCPDHFLRTKVRPLVLDVPASASLEESLARLAELHETYRTDIPRLLRAPRHCGLAADARRRPGDHPRAGRRHVLLRPGQADGPRRRRVLRQRDQRDARRGVRVNVRTDLGAREVPHRVLDPRRGQAAAASEAPFARRAHRAR